MPIRTLIIEDSPTIREQIRKFIETQSPDFEVIAEADSVESGIESIITLKPDFVVFDFIIIGGNSFDIINAFRVDKYLPFNFIFLTGFGNTETSIKAFKYAAIDFLMKPFNEEKFIEVLDDVKQKIDQDSNQEIANNMLFDIIQKPIEANQHLGIIDCTSKIHKITISDIIYLNADGPITHFYLTGDKIIKGNKNIGYYKDNLCQDHEFLQIHQSRIVNMDKFLNYNLIKKLIILTENHEVQPSRSGIKVLKEYLLANPKKQAPKNINWDWLKGKFGGK